MKRFQISATLSTLAVAIAGAVAPAAFAAPHSELAQVISSTPIYVRVASPQRQCWTEQVASVEERRVRLPRQEEFREPERESSGSGAGTVLGAIIGGVVGHQFGLSSGGRDRGTAAGALIGGLIGNSAERNADRGSDSGYRRVSRESVAVEQIPVTRDVQRCQTNTEYREQISGYDVRYRYNGREYSTRLDYDPGQTMQINVDVRPAGRSGPTPSYSRTY
jgi:uncharacterized protein YcfJ